MWMCSFFLRTKIKMIVTIQNNQLFNDAKDLEDLNIIQTDYKGIKKYEEICRNK